jgi:hypothetical protein
VNESLDNSRIVNPLSRLQSNVGRRCCISENFFERGEEQQHKSASGAVVKKPLSFFLSFFLSLSPPPPDQRTAKISWQQISFSPLPLPILLFFFDVFPLLTARDLLYRARGLQKQREKIPISGQTKPVFAAAHWQGEPTRLEKRARNECLIFTNGQIVEIRIQTRLTSEAFVAQHAV